MGDKEWRPIKTAPKDGTAVLLFSPDAADLLPMIGMWTEFTPFSGIEANWTDAWTFKAIDAWPTHWQPLPPPPAGRAA